MNPQEKYPLPDGEKNELVKMVVVSEAIMLAIAIVILIVTIGFATDNWGYAVTRGWAQSIGFAFASGESVGHVAPDPIQASSIFDTSSGFRWQNTTFSLKTTFAAIGLGLGLSILLVGSLVTFDYFGRKKSKAYCEGVMELRQGITGELVRLPMSTVVLIMLLTGLCEELAFRYALMNGIILLLANFISPTIAAVIGLLVTAVAFWGAHEQYRDPFSSGTVLCAGLILGAAYLATGWILVPIVAHAAYNIADVAIERTHVMVEPDYYGGKVPSTLLRDAFERARKDREKEWDD